MGTQGWHAWQQTSSNLCPNSQSRPPVEPYSFSTQTCMHHHVPLPREFLRRKFAGLVEVTVQSASGLPAADVRAADWQLCMPVGWLLICLDMAASRSCMLAQRMALPHSPHPALPVLSQWWPSSKSDPYAVINVGDSAAATSVISQELNPQWGESFYLFVR